MKLPTRNTTQISHAEAGELIRKFRKCRKVSLRSLATALDISAPFLSDLERGRRNWTSERFIATEAKIRQLSPIK
jgi:predicted transcriptional regulator